MEKYYYYSKYTGYSYKLSEHAKMRIWERFRTLDIEREFYLFRKFMMTPIVDDNIVCNMEVGKEVAIKNCYNNKVYIIVLTDNLNVLLKTVYRDSYYRQFVPNDDSVLYRVYKDGTLHKWVKLY
jgi:hypothetical protein